MCGEITELKIILDSLTRVSNDVSEFKAKKIKIQFLRDTINDKLK